MDLFFFVRITVHTGMQTFWASMIFFHTYFYQDSQAKQCANIFHKSISYKWETDREIVILNQTNNKNFI